jgi:hypothetical protein
MADDSHRIGASRISGGAELLRQISGVGGVSGRAPAAERGSVTSAGGSGGGMRGNFGPRGSRVLPPDVPVEQLDRMAARGTYLDILV